ncbi:hypothetical protein DB771_17990 [Burkholderia sp. AU29985]|nr:putative lipoprotein [Burkholderia dolosa AU0158]AKE01955.1 hypothetical protein XM57_02650 [Burkholderia cepacia]AYZ95621.1 hypothetical protein EGY28_10485 [Burkholderia dolosa]ETP61751.1 hypothetical protein BDSB_28820 [Burkholderia dolosa PC543]PRE51075.1 hypothetical protein C6P87_11400 [Burkholderia sp. AU12872]PUA75403.1 hypothetical protein DB771_17990 [Burkholderia sp. AU29985]
MVAVLLGVSLCLSGCTTYQPVVRHAAQQPDAETAVRSTCSDLSVDPRRDVKVGDDIRFTTCDGLSGSMKVAAIDGTRIADERHEVDIRNLSELQVKSVSVGRSALVGLGMGVTVAIAITLVFSVGAMAAMLGMLHA